MLHPILGQVAYLWWSVCRHQCTFFTAQLSTAQHNRAPYSTTQHNTAQHLSQSVLTLQEDLPQLSLSSVSSASIASQHVPEQELLPRQASFASSTLSTPRSLRPGTVPKLDLSPAIAMHMASLENDEEEEEPAHHRQEEEDEGGATQRQAAAMASFDDLSGPDDSDAASEAASAAPSTTAFMTDAGHSVQGMNELLDDADHASTASSAHYDKPAVHTLHMDTTSTAQQSLTTAAASEASPLVTNEHARTPSGETSQKSAAANHAEAALSLHANIAASSTQISVSGAAHAQATAVGSNSSAYVPAVDIGSTHVTDFGLPDDAAQPASTAQISHRLPAVASDESLSTASSSISEELVIAASELSQEASPESSHLSMPQVASVEASAVPSGPDSQAEAASEALLDADDVQLSFGSPDMSPAMLSADMPLLHPSSVGVSSLPLLALNIGKKDSEDTEQQHLAPDLLAYAEAAMTEGDAEAGRHALVSSQATRQAEGPHIALMSRAGVVPEAAGHGQQADNIAAELFDELLTDAVQSMTTTGESALHAPRPACHVILFLRTPPPPPMFPPTTL